MPANLTPDYYKAEKWFKSAGTNDEKILALEEMLRVIPRHKGTDHMRADLRHKLSKLKEAPAKKSGARHADIFHVPAGGAGQIVLLGTPNCGKSSIVGSLTNAKVNIADFPFATGAPVPGMVWFEDVQIQVVDMPPITADFIAPGQIGTYRHCDLIVMVIDVAGEIEQQFKICADFLESRSLVMGKDTPAVDENGNALGKRTICVATKTDLSQTSKLEKLKGLCEDRFEVITFSAQSEAGAKELAKSFFEVLNIIRIYSKRPGKPADMTDPFTLAAGSTVMDLAKAIHRQLAEKLRTAKIWGTGVHPGQNVQRTHVLNDKDIIELHFS